MAVRQRPQRRDRAHERGKCVWRPPFALRHTDVRCPRWPRRCPSGSAPSHFLPFPLGLFGGARSALVPLGSHLEPAPASRPIRRATDHPAEANRRGTVEMGAHPGPTRGNRGLSQALCGCGHLDQKSGAPSEHHRKTFRGPKSRPRASCVGPYAPRSADVVALCAGGCSFFPTESGSAGPWHVTGVLEGYWPWLGGYRVVGDGGWPWFDGRSRAQRCLPCLTVGAGVPRRPKSDHDAPDEERKERSSRHLHASPRANFPTRGRGVVGHICYCSFLHSRGAPCLLLPGRIWARPDQEQLLQRRGRLPDAAAASRRGSNGAPSPLPVFSAPLNTACTLSPCTHTYTQGWGMDGSRRVAPRAWDAKL